MRTKVIIMGAAGRDFHNFNIYFRDNEKYDVIAFTAAQIPNIENRRYPPKLAGKLYPEGIKIYPESEIVRLIREYKVEEVVFSYSDISHVDVMHKVSIVTACGANFKFLGTASTMIQSSKPVISVCAVRTGCGKSQTTRKICKILRSKNRKVVVVRHPMPYGNLADAIVQRFESFDDLDRYNCTVEEREEYEPLIRMGIVVYAGVDYEKILLEAEEEAEIVVWDGGNNDIPFYRPDLHIVVVDPHRPRHEILYHPGETNLRMADVIILNKMDTAKPSDVDVVEKNINLVNPDVTVIKCASPIYVENSEIIEGKKVLVIEDGPTITHGEMNYGAGYIAAKKFGAKEIVDAKPYAVGTLKKMYREYSHIKRVLPAVGYGEAQIRELEATINAIECDLVIEGTPVNLKKILKINKPIVKVTYELEEIEKPDLEDILEDFLGSLK